MTPQSNFMVIAPILPGCEEKLRRALAGMADLTGMADPVKCPIPFRHFGTLHYARFVILRDRALGDFGYVGLPVPDYPIALAFHGDCDGPADDMLGAFVAKAGPALEAIFRHCGFKQGDDLFDWMKQRNHTPAAAYVNTRGRTVQQVHEEAKLRDALVKRLCTVPRPVGSPSELHRQLKAFVDGQNLMLTPPPPTPFGWRVRNALHFLTLPLGVVGLIALLVLFPILLVPLGLLVLAFAVALRWRETHEPELRQSCMRPGLEHALALAGREDHHVVNVFTIIGSVKPGRFRLWLFTAALWLVDWFARHVYIRGYLARIRSIHFARWVFIDGRKRMVFTSYYEGSLDSYNDDFINKVGFGLNFVFGNAFGYPRTRWMFFDGATDEQKFKYTLRRRQIQTDVWYSAYPDLTTFDLARNTRVREGIERQYMSDAAIRAWLGDL